MFDRVSQFAHIAEPGTPLQFRNGFPIQGRSRWPRASRQAIQEMDQILAAGTDYVPGKEYL